MSIYRYVAAGNTRALRQLISEGVDVNANASDESPLHWACFEGNEEIVRILLEAGADEEQLTSLIPLHTFCS